MEGGGSRMKFTVHATRTTEYEIPDATCPDHAIDRMMAGDGKEVDGTTESIMAYALCPDCDQPLTARSMMTVEYEGKMVEVPTYCDACDREISTVHS